MANAAILPGLGGQFLEIHGDGGKVCLDLNVGYASPGRAGQAVLGFGAAVDAFDVPSMPAVAGLGLFVPTFFLAPPGAQQGGVAVENRDGA